MKIDWKHLCTAPGYLSLKKAVVENHIKYNHRTKKESYKLFNFVIARAKHYAHVQQLPIEEILNTWETGRGNMWIFSYYPSDNVSDLKFPKLNRNCPTVKRIKPKDYYKKDPWYRDPVKRKAANFASILREQKLQSKRKGKKARWTKHQKDSAKRMKAYKEKERLENVT